MAEPENFEEDLFADLYTEDDTQTKEDPTPEVKIEINPPSQVKQEAKVDEEELNHAGDQQMYGAEQDVEDEIDFNLGNGNEYDTPPSHHEGHGPGIKEDG